MFDLLLKDGDIVLNNKRDFSLTSSLKDLLKQRMEITFRAFTGEWFLNPSWGAFNKDLFFNKKVTKEILDSYYRDIILNFPEVLSINFFESVYEKGTRIYSFTFSVDTLEETFGYKINIIPPGVEVNYPYFPTELEAIGCVSGVDAETQNLLYELLNIELPSNIPWFN